jgi:transcriptional regulatory protein RtcR
MTDKTKRNVVIGLSGSRPMLAGMWYSPKFDPGCIQNSEALLKKVLEKNDGVSSFLNDQMSSDFRTFVDTYQPSKGSKRKLIMFLVELFNKVVSGPAIFVSERFQEVNLKTDTKELLAKTPQGPDLVLLNRRLLENAYYHEVWKGNLWQPCAELCHPSHGLNISRYEILHEKKFENVADQIADHIEWVAPATEVRKQLMPDLKDAWDFVEVYLSLDEWANSYNFDLERENYLIHMTKGTFVQQICLFTLVESRHIPGILVHNGPPEESQPHGRVHEVDLHLAKYDKIATRFNTRQTDSVSVLKDGIDTRNAAFNLLISEIEHVAVNTADPILLMGPTGAGKSKLAERIYELRKKRNLVSGDFIPINCATIRGDGAMSALFGHVHGAYTGAKKKRDGALLDANKGLLFLDEIGDLGIEAQTMLLQALEKKRFIPFGGDKKDEKESDFQLIAATNQDIYAQDQSNGFRKDLLARINLWPYELPSLRDRLEDIEPNLDYELELYKRNSGKRVRMNKEIREKFLRFATSSEAKWTGNFRDLRGMVKRMTTLAKDGIITPEVLEAQINHIKAEWTRGEARSDYDAILLPLLGETKLAETDLIERIQLAAVIQICQKSKSAAEAGRKLYTANRNENPNYSDLVKKYLMRFDLHFSDCTNIPAN